MSMNVKRENLEVYEYLKRCVFGGKEYMPALDTANAAQMVSDLEAPPCFLRDVDLGGPAPRRRGLLAARR